MFRHWRRAALALVVLLFSVAAVGCGPSQLTELAERVTGPEWQEATSTSGNYVAEFPGKPRTTTESVPGTDLSVDLVLFESGDDAFALSELAMNGIEPNPLDEAVDGAIEGARAALESEWDTVTATEVSRTNGEFEDVESRRYSCDLVGEGHEFVANGLMFYRDDVLVHAMTVTDKNVDAKVIERFLSSVRSVDQRA